MLSTYAEQTMVDTLPVAACVFTGFEYTVNAANQLMLDIWGKDASILGRPLHEVLPELQTQPFVDYLQQTYRNGKDYHDPSNKVVLNVNGIPQEVYLHTSFKPLRDREHNLYGVVCTALNITEQVQSFKMVEQLNQELAAANEEQAASNEELRAINEELHSANEALGESNERLTLARQAARLGLFDWDLKSGIISWDARSRELFGIQHQDRIDTEKDLFGRLHPDDRDRVRQSAEIARNKELSGGNYDIEYRITGAGDVPLRWVRATGKVTFSDTDEPLRFVGTITDITASKRHEAELQELNEELAASNEELTVTIEELKATNDQLQAQRQTALQLRRAAEENETRLYSILETMAEGLALFDMHGKVYYFNETAYQLLNMERGTIKGRTYNDFRWQNLRRDGSIMPAEEHPMFQALATKQAITGYEITLLMADGRMLELLVNTAPLFDMRGRLTGGVATFTDITERTQASRLLEESEARLQDANEELTAINEEQEAVNEELRQAQENLLTANEQLREGEQILELTIQSAGMGTWFADIITKELTFSAQSRLIHGFPADQPLTWPDSTVLIVAEDKPRVEERIRQAIAHKSSFVEEYRITPADGGSTRWLRTTGTLRFDGEGRLQNIFGTILDITEHRILQQQKDDFISIASHELKTPVTSLKAALQLIDKLRDKPDNPMMPKLIMQSRRSVERVSALIEDLLNVSRLQHTEMQLNKQPFILSQLVNTVANPIAIMGRHKVKITGNLELEVNADEHRIDQVITNFLNNAVKYAPESEVFTIDMQQQGNCVKLSVTDQGGGIPEDKRARLFDRYFRVDSSGHHASGLGLGLYISADIIRRHEGEIGVDSELGRGSTFWFTLPLETASMQA